MPRSARFRKYFSAAQRLRQSIARNRHDSDFEREHGELVYVFDTNVFLFYADLDEHRGLTRDFGALVGQEHGSQLTHAIERLTADFLFSGRLPGQRRAGLISLPHLEEIVRSSQVVARRLGQKARRTSTTEGALRLIDQKRINVILSNPNMIAEEKLERLGEIVPTAWLHTLNASSHFRSALQMIFEPDNPTLKPIDQSEWSDLVGALDRTELEQWIEVLPRASAARKPENLIDDALTLQAIVSLYRADRRRDESAKRRFLFVTADEALIAAVDKRMPDLQKDGIPFFARSPRDYLPLLNLNAMRGSLPDTRHDPELERAFRRVFNTLESALDWVAIVADGMESGPVDDDGPLRELEHAWQAASRTVTMLNARHLTEDTSKTFADLVRFIDVDAGRTATRMVQSSVSELRDRHLLLVLENALASLTRAPRREARRVSVQVQTRAFGTLVPAGETISAFLDHVVETGKLPDPTFEALRRSPATFEAQMLACALFVAAERWEVAEQFATQAVELAMRSRANMLRVNEASYLLALCLRFSMRSSVQFRRARKLLVGNIKRSIRRDGPSQSQLHRLRDEMELANLLLSVAVDQEIGRTELGRKIVGGNRRFVLVDEDISHQPFQDGVRRLCNAREELLESEAIDNRREHSETADLAAWLKASSATNLLGAYIFERIVPGLQHKQPLLTDCREVREEVEVLLARQRLLKLPIRPTQEIYLAIANMLTVDTPEREIDGQQALGDALAALQGEHHSRPLGDRLEFAFIAQWLELQHALLEMSSAPWQLAAS